MHFNQIMTDSIGRKLQYGDDGVLRFVKGDHPAITLADIPQPWHFRVLSALLAGAAKVRW